MRKKEERQEEKTVEESTRRVVEKAEKPSALDMTEAYFGPFWKYITNDEITDIDYNGTDLWITDTSNKREKVEEHGITQEFVLLFSQNVANRMSKPFNKVNNVLEAETDTLRISIIHESVAVTGRSICIRKSMPKIRINAKKMIAEKYCPEAALHLMTNCVLSHMNFIFCGEPGVGKTELAKFCSQFIPAKERVITIEDNLEWHFRAINPGNDCIEMKINKEFSYVDGIKASLRQNPKWLMVSEIRSVEAKFLLESWSTGVHGITTLHCDDIRKVPSRILNMMPNREDADRLENDVYEFTDVVCLIRRKSNPDGSAFRYIDQLGFLYREDRENKVSFILKNGELVNRNIPYDIAEKFRFADIKDPFFNDQIKLQIGGQMNGR